MINLAIQNPPPSYGFLLFVKNENTGNGVAQWEGCPVTGCSFNLGLLAAGTYSYQAKVYGSGGINDVRADSGPKVLIVS